MPMKKALAQRYKEHKAFKSGDVLTYRDERTGSVMHASVLEDDESVEGFSIVVDMRSGVARRVPTRVYGGPADWLRSCIPSCEISQLTPSTLRTRFRTFRIRGD